MQWTFETIKKQLENKSWSKAQDKDFLKAVERAESSIVELVSHLYGLVNYFEQYVAAVHNSPLFDSALKRVDNDDVSTNPTQTPAPAAQGADNA